MLSVGLHKLQKNNLVVLLAQAHGHALDKMQAVYDSDFGVNNSGPTLAKGSKWQKWNFLQKSKNLSVISMSFKATR